MWHLEVWLSCSLPFICKATPKAAACRENVAVAEWLVWPDYVSFSVIASWFSSASVPISVHPKSDPSNR